MTMNEARVEHKVHWASLQLLRAGKLGFLADRTKAAQHGSLLTTHYTTTTTTDPRVLCTYIHPSRPFYEHQTRIQV